MLNDRKQMVSDIRFKLESFLSNSVLNRALRPNIVKSFRWSSGHTSNIEDWGCPSHSGRGATNITG